MRGTQVHSFEKLRKLTGSSLKTGLRIPISHSKFGDDAESMGATMPLGNRLNGRSTSKLVLVFAALIAAGLWAQ
jgi:hypothetical protein